MTEQPSVLDESFSRVNFAQLPATIVGLCRYLTGSGKALSGSESAQIHAAGRFIVLNDETTANAALGGKSAGQASGAAAGAAARADGAPAACVIHPSVDFDVTNAAQMNLVEQFMIGYQQESGYGQGAYGEYDVIETLAAAGLLTTGFGWQTIAWSNNKLSAHAGLYQYLINQSMAGASVDFNRLINLPGLGAWMPDGSSSVTSPAAVWGQVLPVPMLGPGVADTAGDLLATVRGLLSEIESKIDTLKTTAATDQAALLTAIAALATSSGGSTADQIAEATVNLMAGVPIIATIGAKTS